MTKLEASYLEGGYFDKNQKPRRELYTDWAKYIASELSKEGVTRGSLRKFYAQFKGVEHLLKNEKDFELNKHRIYKVEPYAHYAVTREEKLPWLLKLFFDKNINMALISHHHFHAFVDHFQSIIAYSRAK